MLDFGIFQKIFRNYKSDSILCLDTEYPNFNSDMLRYIKTNYFIKYGYELNTYFHIENKSFIDEQIKNYNSLKSSTCRHTEIYLQSIDIFNINDIYEKDIIVIINKNTHDKKTLIYKSYKINDCDDMIYSYILTINYLENNEIKSKLIGVSHTNDFITPNNSEKFDTLLIFKIKSNKCELNYII